MWVCIAHARQKISAAGPGIVRDSGRWPARVSSVVCRYTESNTKKHTESYAFLRKEPPRFPTDRSVGKT